MKINVELEDYVRAKVTEFLTVDTNSDIIQPMTDWIVNLVEENCKGDRETFAEHYEIDDEDIK